MEISVDGVPRYYGEADNVDLDPHLLPAPLSNGYYVESNAGGSKAGKWYHQAYSSTGGSVSSSVSSSAPSSVSSSASSSAPSSVSSSAYSRYGPPVYISTPSTPHPFGTFPSLLSWRNYNDGYAPPPSFAVKTSDDCSIKEIYEGNVMGSGVGTGVGDTDGGEECERLGGQQLSLSDPSESVISPLHRGARSAISIPPLEPPKHRGN